MNALPTRVLISKDVVFRSIGGETVLLDLRGENCFSLDRIGARIWSQLAADPEVPHAIAALLDEYDVAENTLRASLTRLIGELEAAGLVHVER